MKNLVLVLVAFISIVARADDKMDSQTAISILKKWAGISIVCIDKDTAFGFSWDYDSRTVVTSISTPAKDFGSKQTLILDTFPGAVRLKIPTSKNNIDSDLIVAEDAQGSPIVLTYGSIGKVENMLCAYRADDILFSNILQSQSAGTIVLE